MRYICTYFDKNFLPRGLALLESLEKNSQNFTFYVLALDNTVVNYFENLGNHHVVVITLQEYAEHFKIDKSKYKNEKEFYFSLTPSLCLYILDKYDGIDILLYLDADVCLFNTLETLYDEMGSASIAMCNHRLPWYIKLMSKNYGIYNVGVNMFRNDLEGIACLKQWHSDCSNWMSGQKGYSLSFFSDQIWLDKWPSLYKNLKIIDNIGVNVAPWNAIQYTFTKKEDVYYVNDTPLVIYHFSSLKFLGKRMWHGNTSFTLHNISNTLLTIYEEYLYKVAQYTLKQESDIINLKFSGNKIKMFVYKIAKLFHNHTITLDKDK